MRRWSKLARRSGFGMAGQFGQGDRARARRLEAKVEGLGKPEPPERRWRRRSAEAW